MGIHLKVSYDLDESQMFMQRIKNPDLFLLGCKNDLSTAKMQVDQDVLL